MYDLQSLPRPDQDRSLREVISDLGGGLCAAGADESGDDWDAYGAAFRRLVAWAGTAGALYPDLQPERAGGREHDVTFDPRSETWLKFTWPASAGYLAGFDPDRSCFALAPGLPAPYLERLALQNELFSDDVTFAGVGGALHRPRLITCQSNISGKAATIAEITYLMVNELGFRPLPPHLALGYQRSLAFIREDAVVFDLRPANVVRMADGLIVPIDCIPARVDAASRGWFERWLKR